MNNCYDPGLGMYKAHYIRNIESSILYITSDYHNPINFTLVLKPCNTYKLYTHSGLICGTFWEQREGVTHIQEGLQCLAR